MNTTDSHTTKIIDGNGTTEVRHTWPVEQAAEALAQFLEQAPRGYSAPRGLVDETGATVAVIASIDHVSEGEAAVRTLDRAAAHHPSPHPTAYRPHVDGINADYLGNGALPYAQLKPIIEQAARVFAGIGKDDPLPAKFGEADTDSLVALFSIQCAVDMVIDADTAGAVPVLMGPAHLDGPEAEQRWMLAYRTPVAGLYLRGSAGFFGDEFDVITANGWKMLGGFTTRALGEAFCAALGEALPGIDWRTMEMSSVTSSMKATIMDTLNTHGRWSAAS